MRHRAPDLYGWLERQGDDLGHLIGRERKRGTGARGILKVGIDERREIVSRTRLAGLTAADPSRAPVFDGAASDVHLVGDGGIAKAVVHEQDHAGTPSDVLGCRLAPGDAVEMLDLGIREVDGASAGTRHGDEAGGQAERLSPADCASVY